MQPLCGCQQYPVPGFHLPRPFIKKGNRRTSTRTDTRKLDWRWRTDQTHWTTGQHCVSGGQQTLTKSLNSKFTFPPNAFSIFKRLTQFPSATVLHQFATRGNMAFVLRPAEKGWPAAVTMKWRQGESLRARIFVTRESVTTPWCRSTFVTMCRNLQI